MTLMATFTEVEPLTPRCAIYATPNEKATAIAIMNIGPGLDALMNDGQMVPAR